MTARVTGEQNTEPAFGMAMHAQVRANSVIAETG
jgi:hypothetical protein